MLAPAICGGEVELIEQDDDFLFTYPNFLIDCQKRPEVGRSLGVRPDPYPEISLETFELLCEKYGLAKQTEKIDASPISCQLISEPQPSKIIEQQELGSNSIDNKNQKTTFVKYNVKIANEDIFKDNEYLRGSFDKAIKESKSLKFGLICKNNNSFFYNIEQLSTEEGFNSNKTTLIFANYMGEIYQEKDSLLTFSSLLGNKTYIKKVISKNWILQNEIKIIDGYKYGFLEPIHKFRTKYEAKLFDLLLYTRDSDSNQSYWVTTLKKSF